MSRPVSFGAPSTPALRRLDFPEVDFGEGRPDVWVRGASRHLGGRAGPGFVLESFVEPLAEGAVELGMVGDDEVGRVTHAVLGQEVDFRVATTA